MTFNPSFPIVAPSLAQGVPDPTGAKIEPQSPSGTSVTITGRTQSATQVKLGTMRIQK